MSNTKDSKKKLIILCPYPLAGAPSQRFRYEQYLSILEEYGYQCQILSFLDEKTNQVLYQPRRTSKKAWGIVLGYLRRLSHVWQSRQADAVFIHREATPLGPPWVEWLVAQVLRKPIIYDFDDAIWLADQSGVNRWVSRLKWRSKVRQICSWSYRVSGGNAYLANFGQQSGTVSVINPTTIDTEHYHNQLKNQHDEPLTIGWTGSHSTLKYLTPVTPALNLLAKSYNFRFVVIANRPPDFNLPNLAFIKWNKHTEIEDLLQINIGIMPLPNDPWSKGKCGFKALQYLALGIPAVVSPVGVNTKIVQPDVHGFHALTEDDWYDSLQKLLTDNSLRKKMGQAGREHVINYYSIQSNTANFLRLFPGNWH
ncbi:MAG: glycosyltransferase family 4 protein [Bacteroidota bacterium]